MNKKRISNKVERQRLVRSSDLLSGADLIALERDRQIRKEGWSIEHDDRHRRKEMAHAADSYLAAHIHPDGDGNFTGSEMLPAYNWPWAKKWWKPSDDPIRNLVKVGALIAAEIDRLQRLKIGEAPRCRHGIAFDKHCGRCYDAIHGDPFKATKPRAA